MLRFIFWFLFSVSVEAGLLDWFQLLSWHDKQVFSHQWTDKGVNYQTVSTLSFVSVCDWSQGKGWLGTIRGGDPKFGSDNANRNRFCGSTCSLLTEAFGVAGYPFASSGYSESDHVNFVCMVPSSQGKTVLVTNEGDAKDGSANVLLTFRGTFAWDIVNNRRNTQSTFHATSLCTTCAVHRGFWRNFVALKYAIVKVVHLAAITDSQKIQKFAIAQSDWKLAVFGHSMGAALSHLSASYFKHVLQRTIVGLFTMGTPRVGNRPFAKHVSLVALNYAILHNSRDPVPRYSRIFGYRHTEPMYELFMDPVYFLGASTGDVDKEYSKYIHYRIHDSDQAFAEGSSVHESSAHMNYFIGLDQDDIFTCGGMSDYYMKNTKATSLFG